MSVGLGLDAARSFDCVGPVLSRHHALDLQLLLGSEREQLVCRLSDLKRAFGILTSRDDCRKGLAIGLDVADDLRLDTEGVLQRGPGDTEARLCG